MFRSNLILIEDSRLMQMCWRIECQEQIELQIFATPREFFESLSQTTVNPNSIFVVDVDFGGLDPMNGVELAESLRRLGLENKIHLYSGFSDVVSNGLLIDGTINGVHSKDLSPKELIRRIQAAS